MKLDFGQLLRLNQSTPRTESRHITEARVMDGLLQVRLGTVGREGRMGGGPMIRSTVTVENVKRLRAMARQAPVVERRAQE